MLLLKILRLLAPGSPGRVTYDNALAGQGHQPMVEIQGPELTGFLLFKKKKKG